MVNDVPRRRLLRAHSPDSEHRAARPAQQSSLRSRGVARHNLAPTPFDGSRTPGARRPRSHAVRRFPHSWHAKTSLPRRSTVPALLAREDLAPTPFDASRTPGARRARFPRRSTARANSDAHESVGTRQRPQTLTPTWAHATNRTSPPGRRRAPALALPALGGTRAHRPKAEHAGRTTPRPRGGNHSRGQCI